MALIHKIWNGLIALLVVLRKSAIVMDRTEGQEQNPSTALAERPNNTNSYRKTLFS